jgi:DNA adenine methylase
MNKIQLFCAVGFYSFMYYNIYINIYLNGEIVLFRYPGGKSKISDLICHKIESVYVGNNCSELMEPFFGSGAITLKLAKNNIIKRAWPNDKDKGIAEVWNAIYYQPEKLIELIIDYKPNVEDFYKFKSELLDENYVTGIPYYKYKWDHFIEIAFKKIVIHQISYSGLGTKAGSPIGGKKQIDENNNPKKYQIDCRWSPKNLSKNIRLANQYFHKLWMDYAPCTSYDYKVVLEWGWESSFLYLDPPYYDKGEQLYQKSFTHQDHMDLCEILKTRYKYWLLSYDNNPTIRELYCWANIEEIPIRYTINNNLKQCKELLISPHYD